MTWVATILGCLLAGAIILLLLVSARLTDVAAEAVRQRRSAERADDRAATAERSAAALLKEVNRLSPHRCVGTLNGVAVYERADAPDAMISTNAASPQNEKESSSELA